MKIRWNMEERAQILDALKPLLGGDTDLWRLVKEAQKVLEKDRQRIIAHPTHVPTGLRRDAAEWIAKHPPVVKPAASEAALKTDRALELEQEIILLKAEVAHLRPAAAQNEAVKGFIADILGRVWGRPSVPPATISKVKDRRVLAWTRFISHSSTEGIPKENLKLVASFREIQDELTRMAVQ